MHLFLMIKWFGFVLACNILVEGTSYVYTLSNHGRRINCSVTTLFPATVSLVSLDVGFSEQSRMSRTSSRHHLIAHRSNAGGVIHNVSILSLIHKSRFLNVLNSFYDLV